MLKHQPIILGIDPGSRQIGVAIICGEEILYYGIKTIKDRVGESQSLKNLEKIILKLTAEYEVDCIALEKVISAQQRNSSVESVYRNIKAIAKKSNFELREYSPKLVRNLICQQEKGTRRETYRLLTERFSELSRYYSATRSWQKAYFAHLFDAIAVALICVREFEGAGEYLSSITVNSN